MNSASLTEGSGVFQGSNGQMRKEHPNDLLYTAYRIELTFKDPNEKEFRLSGTAFFVKDSNGHPCLFTNRHLVDVDYGQRTAKYKGCELTSVSLFGIKLNIASGLSEKRRPLSIKNFKEFRFSATYENDVACLKEPKVDYDSEGEHSVSFCIGYDQIANQDRLHEKLTLCDIVAFPGFPETRDKLNERPIMRMGSIASDPRFNYSHTGNYEGDRVAYEAFSFNGSSGSPVFALPKGIYVDNKTITGGNFRERMLVGINAGHIQIGDPIGGHSGISYFYKSTIILELIEGIN